MPSFNLCSSRLSSSLSLVAPGIAGAELEFDHPNYVSKAEKSWKVIAGVLQHILRSHFFAERRSNPSENSGYTPTRFITRDKYIETSSSDSGSQILRTCCHGNEMVTSIQNSDGNALTVRVCTPHRSLPDNSVERENLLEAGLNLEIMNGFTDSVKVKPESRPRPRQY